MYKKTTSKYQLLAKFYLKLGLEIHIGSKIVLLLLFTSLPLKPGMWLMMQTVMRGLLKVVLCNNLPGFIPTLTILNTPIHARFYKKYIDSLSEMGRRI